MGKVIVALDVPSRDQALEVVEELGTEVTFYKVGLELFSRTGPAMVDDLRELDKRVFLDLKLHDIPNTVAGAVRAAVDHGVEFLTVHVGGGESMLRAAVEAGQGRVGLLGVTVLTSLDQTELGRIWGRKDLVVEDVVLRMAELARGAGLDGVVASPLEVAAIRERTGPDFVVATPGIRPSGTGADDQARIADPAMAVRAGADHLVVGRAVTGASDPRSVVRRIRLVAEGAREDDEQTQEPWKGGGG